MKLNKLVLTMAALLLFTFSCEDEDLAPIVTFDSAGKGAYPRLISETGARFINLFDVAGSSYSYDVEFIDNEGGALVAQYVLDLVYEDNDDSNGDNSIGPIEFASFSTSDFSTNSNGLVQAPNVSITGPAAFAAAGVTEDQVSAGDNFRFQGKLILTDGSVFTFDNSSTTVNGAAFRGHFNFTLAASCPSDLTGTYNYTTTDVWCDGSTVTGTVDIISKSDGVYYFSDWSLGSYGPCYGGTADQPGLTFDEVCAEVFFTGFQDSFGDTWTYDSSIDGENWIINWENTYNESANSVITFPGGVPFTLR